MSVRPYQGAKRVWSVKDALAQAFQTNPRLANAVTGGLTFALGDVIAQKLELVKTGSSKKLDLWRSMQIGCLGVAMNGFFLHHWYHSLDRVLGSSMTCKIGVAGKVIADQFVFAPFAIAAFFGFNSARQASSVEETEELFASKMETSFVSTFLADCSLWPAANFVNFRYIPLAYRPSFTAAVQLVWQTYLSATFAQQQQPQPHSDASATVSVSASNDAPSRKHVVATSNLSATVAGTAQDCTQSKCSSQAAQQSSVSGSASPAMEAKGASATATA